MLATLFWHAVVNPLVILLAVLASISFTTGDFRAGIMMSLMLVLGVGLKLIQEAKADSAAAKLKAMISVTATVIRHGQAQEIAVAKLVPGDVVVLTAGGHDPPGKVLAGTGGWGGRGTQGAIAAPHARRRENEKWRMENEKW